MMSLFALPAQAGTSCLAQYETAADDYWRIVSDMTQFKALFDNYNTLCQKYYPDEIAALQPDADHLRAQTAKDMNDAPRVITKIFADTLPAAVSKDCATDKKSRAQALRAFLANMKSRAKSMNARMQKSGKTIRDPDSELKLCRDLPSTAPMIRKKLGPNLSTPLLSMSELNSKYMVGDASKMKAAFATYRETLQNLPPEMIKSAPATPRHRK